MPASIFSETELARLASFPEEIPGDDLIRAFTLTGADRDLVAIRRRAANRLGLALQLLCTSLPRLRSAQFERSSAIGRLLCRGPARRSARTRFNPTLDASRRADSTSPRFGNPSASRCSGHGTWKNSKLGLSNGPLSTRLRRFSFASLVSGCAPRGSSFQHPTESYDLSVRRAVAHRRERTPWSSLKWLGQGASGESPGSIKSEVAKLAFLRQLGAPEWDLSDLNPNRRKFLAQVGRRSTSQTLQRMPDRRRPDQRS